VNLLCSSIVQVINVWMFPVRSVFFTAGYSNKTVEDIKEAFHVDQFVSHTDVEFDDLSPQVIRAYKKQENQCTFLILITSSCCLLIPFYFYVAVLLIIFLICLLCSEKLDNL